MSGIATRRVVAGVANLLVRGEVTTQLGMYRVGVSVRRRLLAAVHTDAVAGVESVESPLPAFVGSTDGDFRPEPFLGSHKS